MANEPKPAISVDLLAEWGITERASELERFVADLVVPPLLTAEEIAESDRAMAVIHAEAKAALETWTNEPEF